MQLPAAHRREVIEDLLDIGIFSRMNALLKDRIKDVRDELKDCDHSVSLAEQKYNLQKDNIANLEKVNKNFDDQLVTRYENNEKEIDAIYSEIQEKQKRTEESSLISLRIRKKLRRNLNRSRKSVPNSDTNLKE